MKVALLIGVSESGYGLPPLPTAVNDIEAMRRVLHHSDMGGFDEVKTLLNPNPPVMREAIQALFSNRSEQDLVVLFFSGYGVKDEKDQLYFTTGITATRVTSTNLQGELVKATALPATSVSEILSTSSCQNSVLILNLYFSRAFPQGITPSQDDTLAIKSQLGGIGWTLLTSCTSPPNSSELYPSQVSIYTRYFVEGLETGAAERDGDSWISLEELNDYITQKIQATAPAWKPHFYSIHKPPKILLKKVRLDEPKLKYWKEIERLESNGKISPMARYTLERLSRALQLFPDDCAALEAAVLKPYQEYQDNVHYYTQSLSSVMQKGYPLSQKDREELGYLQQALGLTDQDIAPLEARVRLRLTSDDLGDEDGNQPSESNSPDSSFLIHSEPTGLPFIKHPSIETNYNQLNASNIANDNNERAIAPSAPTAPTPHLPTPSSDQNLDQQTPSETDDQQTVSNPVGSTFTSVPSWYMETPSVSPNRATPGVNSFLSMAASQGKSQNSTSSFNTKLLLLLGISGTVLTVGLLISLATQKPIFSPPHSTNSVSSSPQPSPRSSNSATPSETVSSPTPKPSPKPTRCLITVNGNLRSEPASFRNNVINSSRQNLQITGKQTPGGWVQVKLGDGGLGWAHRDVIDNEEEIDTCIAEAKIPIHMVEDIIPPPPQSDSSP